MPVSLGYEVSSPSHCKGRIWNSLFASLVKTTHQIQQTSRRYRSIRTRRLSARGGGCADWNQSVGSYRRPTFPFSFWGKVERVKRLQPCSSISCPHDLIRVSLRLIAQRCQRTF